MADTPYVEGLNRVLDDQEAHDTLQAEVIDPADQEYLDEAQREIDKARADLGKTATKVVLTPEGTVEDAATVANAFREGHDRPGAYDGHGRE